jgi:hypothetical protein
MDLHGNAALSWSGRRDLARRVVVDGWTVTAAAEAAGVSVRGHSKPNDGRPPHAARCLERRRLHPSVGDDQRARSRAKGRRSRRQPRGVRSENTWPLIVARKDDGGRDAGPGSGRADVVTDVHEVIREAHLV